jgi:ADP-ribosyl-[dinitrogen reductase] hydrolase
LLLSTKKPIFNYMQSTQSHINYGHAIQSALFGVATGDALGVPVEFKSRQQIAQQPVTDMIGYGTYNLPPGTWSDDSSLTFCLAEALTKGFDLQSIAHHFVRWVQESYWTPRGHVFDIGIATSQAINRLANGVRPDLAGGFEVGDNGNGALMRILPLLFYIHNQPIEKRYEMTKQVSAITHGHIRSVIACFYYLELTRQLLQGIDKWSAYKHLQQSIPDFLDSLGINPAEIAQYDRLLKSSIHEQTADGIRGSGYVLHTLEASVWCLLTTDSYAEAVLKAVNLGEDTDTTGAVTGGLAGLLYGVEAIPATWRTQLARYGDIEDLAERLAKKVGGE